MFRVSSNRLFSAGFAAIFVIAAMPALAGELTTDWDLTELYADMEAWKAAKEKVP